jgi:hypothetical protein
LSEQKGCREQVRRAQYRLEHGNKAVYSTYLHMRKWSDERSENKQRNHNADSHRSLLRGCRHQRDHDWGITIRRRSFLSFQHCADVRSQRLGFAW